MTGTIFEVATWKKYLNREHIKLYMIKYSVTLSLLSTWYKLQRGYETYTTAIPLLGAIWLLPDITNQRKTVQ